MNIIQCICKSVLTKKHKELNKDLLKAATLTIEKFDKGSGFVLLNKNDCIDKVNIILDDKLMYKFIQVNITVQSSRHQKLYFILQF